MSCLVPVVEGFQCLPEVRRAQIALLLGLPLRTIATCRVTVLFFYFGFGFSSRFFGFLLGPRF